MRVFPRERAFHLFCEGNSLSAIAEAIGYHRSTVERYCAKEKWRKLREDYYRVKRAEVACQRVGILAKRHQSVNDSLFEMFLDARAEFAAYRNGSIPKKKLRYSLKNLISLARGIAETGNLDVANAYRMERAAADLTKRFIDSQLEGSE